MVWPAQMRSLFTQKIFGGQMIDQANRITLIALVILAAVVAGYAGHTIGYSNGYYKGYADNTFYDHGCSVPDKVGDVIECHRFPIYLGKSESGDPAMKVLVEETLFERWIWARDSKNEPATGINCKINRLGEVGDCSFTVG
jgi:5-formyltetrahydrofolate cyclo-ligase